ncbi:MAG: hypothetical protein MHPSP_004675, partial [Paramarteilia canceri]
NNSDSTKSDSVLVDLLLNKRIVEVNYVLSSDLIELSVIYSSESVVSCEDLVLRNILNISDSKRCKPYFLDFLNDYTIVL